MSNYVTIPLAASQTGLTEKAIRRKIEEGVWLEGRHYVRGPDGRVYISMKGYEAWVEQKGLKSDRAASASNSHGTARGRARLSPSAAYP